jgi:hypothetical protein
MIRRVVSRYLARMAVVTQPFDAARVRKIQNDVELVLKNYDRLETAKDYERLVSYLIPWNHKLDKDLKAVARYLQDALMRDPEVKDIDKQLNLWRTKLRPLWLINSRIFPPSWEYWGTGSSATHARIMWREELLEALQGLPGVVKFLEGLRKRRKVVPETPDVTERNMLLAGFDTSVVGFDSDDPKHVAALDRVQDALKVYQAKANRALPELIRKKVPLILRFDVETILGAAGQLGDDTLVIFPLNNQSVRQTVYTLAHEMAHRLGMELISHKARVFWNAAIKGDWGNLDLRDVLKSWKGQPFWEWFAHLRTEDPILYLQIDALTSGYAKTLPKELLDNWTIEGIEAYLAKGGNPVVRVPQTPITGYSSANPDEAFAEAVALVVTYGPKALHPKVLSWLHDTLPGELKVAANAPARSGVR